jgi:cell division protein FtsZ
MIPYHRNPQQTLPSSSVKIIGLGGAGVNMLERVALDGTEGAELLALNTDVRTLAACVAGEKIQLGRNLTKGLGAGGDPELGHQAMLEAEAEIRAALRGRRIVFLCVGLGGGTGSGAAPMITRIAREEGAFVVVFATMPFAFEGRRRREQAETTLNELAVLSNALVTFDNNRMGELVLAKQGIHEAFAAADHMVCESIKAVIRLVIRPGLINIGLDDLMSALRTNRSRCLFGSGLAKGKDRASCALRNALASPLLDQGALLKDAQTVLVHLSGGEDLTLYEVELLMQRLQKFVPESAHVLFGAVIDPTMGDSLSVTLISALPEDSLAAAPRDSVSSAAEKLPLDPSDGFAAEIPPPAPAATMAPAPSKPLDQAAVRSPLKAQHEPAQAAGNAPVTAPVASAIHTAVQVESEPSPRSEPAPASSDASERTDKSAPLGQPYVFKPAARTANPSKNTWGKPSPPASGGSSGSLAAPSESNPQAVHPDPFVSALDPVPELSLGVKSQVPQNELAFDSTPRGRFEGQTPNVVDGEDLDLPPFLRKKK